MAPLIRPTRIPATMIRTGRISDQNSVMPSSKQHRTDLMPPDETTCRSRSENPKRDLIHMDINVDNCIEDKARYFAPVWKLITQNFDVISCSEMSHKGLSFLADLTGFTPIKGEMETEFQQSNCALVNPKRLKVSQTIDIWQTAFDPTR